MSGWKGIVGLSFTPDEFDSYCHSLQWNAWRPSFVVLHNTAIPSLAQRPAGITKAHIQNFVSYYRDVEGWSSGPHLFIDDRQIWVFTPLTAPGTHSPSWNNVSLGAEMLGDYEQEPFDSGRGLLVQKNAVAALATLCGVLGIDSQTLRLHREDPLTTHATCPGRHVAKAEVIQAVQGLIVARHPGEHTIQSDGTAPAPSGAGAPAGVVVLSETPAPSGPPVVGTSAGSAASGTAVPAGTPATTGIPAQPDPAVLPASMVPTAVSASSGPFPSPETSAPAGTPNPAGSPPP